MDLYELAARRVETSLVAYLRDQVVAGRLRDRNPNRMAQILMGFCPDRQTKMLWRMVSANDHNVDADAALTTRFLRFFGTGTTIGPSV